MPDRIAEIRTRLDGASIGPWERNNQHTKQLGIAGAFGLCATAWKEGDADLIANAPADLAWLLARVAELSDRVLLMEAIR